LQRYAAGSLKNLRGLTVGQVRPCFQLAH